MSSLKHSSIGPIVGNATGDCIQYLGIKYATLKDRFSLPEEAQYNGSGLNAESFGPQVVSPKEGVDMELGMIGQSLPKANFPGISDTNGLTLNITVPRSREAEGFTTKLPVLVFIHGGGYAIGGNWWPQYDFSKLVKLSTDQGTPIIGITINYRIGVPGFLTSPELRAMGYKPNNGLRDQKAALRWIKKHINGFGGDPDNITVMGESAGAVSTGYLLLSDEPVARRLICLGGSPPLMGISSTNAADQNFTIVKGLLGLENVPSTEIVTRLLQMPIQDFLTKISPGISIGPVEDGDILPRQFTFGEYAQHIPKMPGTPQIESILLGYSKLDASIMAYSGLLQRTNGVASAFRESASRCLQDYPKALASLLDTYSLSEAQSASTSDQDALLNILEFFSDAVFFLPTIEIGKQFPNESFIVAFNEPNPWKGIFKGRPSHILDVAFLFQNFNNHLDEQQRATAVAFGKDIIGFVNGTKPWRPFNQNDSGIGLLADGKRQYVESTIEGTNHGSFILQLANDPDGPGMDKLIQVFTNFMANGSS
ncbi:Alpha/Beta hydrolase protein [Dactylonectria estremocensis]|uniref:Carboxylic ester hydrolase n=1 Tax=Dactylonectria estremocensis TaxID=1079267 RepID=A0A9P9EGH8_9HYPO|nr:Alpha/Beta hydrolase protein [Dactylonectria estremocensis]